MVQKGQLGHGDLCQRNIPMVVEALKGLTVTAGAGGKHHTVVVTSSGDSWAFGLNSTVNSLTTAFCQVVSSGEHLVVQVPTFCY